MRETLGGPGLATAPSVERLFSTPANPAMGPQWFVLQTKPGQERRAREQLLQAGYRCILPMHDRSAAAGAPAREPRFARYAFVQLEDAAAQLARLYALQAVTGLLHIAGRPAPVPGPLLARLLSAGDDVGGEGGSRPGYPDLGTALNGHGVARALALIELMCNAPDAELAPAAPVLQAA